LGNKEKRIVCRPKFCGVWDYLYDNFIMKNVLAYIRLSL